MCKSTSLTTLIILLGTVSGQESGDQQLVYVQALWRHGDRAPNRLPYPNDKYNETMWPRGWAQIGMMQLYELGQFFRQRYSSFIKEFNLDDVSMISSKSDRAIVSGQAMFRGFFPASGQQQWLKGEQWQPLPLHIAPTNAMLKPTSFNCPVYDRVSDEENVALHREINEKYAQFFDFLANVTGFANMNFQKAASLYNIQREIDHNMPQPDWVYRTWPEYGGQTTLQIITDLKRIDRISDFNSPEKARLRGGLLLDEWIIRAKNVSLGLQLKPRKMQLYSSHDGTVLSLMYAMGVGNDMLVPYAACLFMEMYKDTQNNITIKLFYKNDTGAESVHQLKLPGCDLNDCTVTKLMRAVASETVQNQKQLEQACGLNGSSITITVNHFAMLLVTMFHVFVNQMTNSWK